MPMLKLLSESCETVVFVGILWCSFRVLFHASTDLVNRKNCGRTLIGCCQIQTFPQMIAEIPLTLNWGQRKTNLFQRKWQNLLNILQSVL